ncbi:MAG: hypothetical protein RL518_1982 [Pseudomonadota bacterium]|jgi:hypothetical protein
MIEDRMDLVSNHSEAPFISASGNAPPPPSQLRMAMVTLCVLLPFLITVFGSKEGYAEHDMTPLISEGENPGISLLPSSNDGGYATTSFTPPWNTTQALTIFATSSTQTGNLGGLEGARALCQRLADAVPALAGTAWYPLLSDSTYDASTLTGKSAASAPIYNIDRSVIAVNRASLWSGGTLTTGVKGTETGATRYDTVFTGTNSTGGKTGSLCSNWTSTSGNGTVGATNDRSSNWIGGFITSCAVSYRIYCIGNYDPTQPPTTPSPTPTNTRTPTPIATSTPTITPTSTSTPTPTPIAPTSTPTRTPTPAVGTATPTPSVALVNVQVRIDQTPVPALPVYLGADIVNTDTQGYASTTVSSTSLLTVQTGLPAVSFTPITGEAASFHNRTVLIEASRLIVPSPEICSVVVANVPHLFFPYSSLSDTALSVPLSFHRLNRILSPSGLAAPAALFAPGESGNGFILPRYHFESGPTLVGTWEFLAAQVSIPESPIPCAERGTPATPLPTSCSSFDLSVIFRETKQSITNLSQESLKAAARGEWKPKGVIREPFLRAGSSALKKMLLTIEQMGTNLQSCTTPPSETRCSVKPLNKAAIKSDFSRAFPKNLPRGLARVKKRIPGEIARFGRIVDALPSTLYSCP